MHELAGGTYGLYPVSSPSLAHSFRHIEKKESPYDVTTFRLDEKDSPYDVTVFDNVFPFRGGSIDSSIVFVHPNARQCVYFRSSQFFILTFLY